MVRDKEAVAGFTGVAGGVVCADDSGWDDAERQFDPDDPLSCLTADAINAILQHPEHGLFSTFYPLALRAGLVK